MWVVERETAVGGNAGSFEIAGLRVDYGSHRLHPASHPQVLQRIRGVLGDREFETGRYRRAAELIEEIVTRADFEEFTTVVGYRELE